MTDATSDAGCDDDRDAGNASPSRRGFLGQAAAAALIGAGGRPAAAAGIPGGFYTQDQIDARDAANLAAAVRARGSARYLPLTGGIVHFFGYGQSLSGGYYGEPVLSTTQPYDNLMIGVSTHPVSHASDSINWVPQGTPDGNGIYPFNPMIATVAGPAPITPGETPGEGAMNYLRRAYLQQLKIHANPACRFVLTNCSVGGKTIADLQKGANPETFNRLRDAANYVKATAASLGLSYQVGGMIFTHGEDDVLYQTSYADYLAGLQTLQQSFLTDIVQAIAGQPAGTVVPWVCGQPDSAAKSPPAGTAVYQALLDWSNTQNSDMYLAGPLYQYPNHDVHLTANGYRWHANQVGKVFTSVLLKQLDFMSLHMKSATFAGTSVLVNLNVPSPPLVVGDVYVLYAKTSYPSLGFIVTDGAGPVPITAVAIVGKATIQIQLGRTLQGSATLQAGYNSVAEDWGTNICDSGAIVAQDIYVYQAGVQDAGENIATWNGAPLIGKPYPLANYLAIGSVPITPG